MISLVYHSTLSAAQGTVAMQVIDKMIASNDYLLVLEGSIPAGMPEACMMGGRTLESILLPAPQTPRRSSGSAHVPRSAAFRPPKETKPVPSA